MKKSVLILSQHYAPEPLFVSSDLAEAIQSDADVTVVTGHPNYPRGKFYGHTSYWRPQKEVINGVKVWRLPLYPYHGSSKLKRAISYLSFALLATLWAPLVCSRPNVVWVYQSPFSTALASLFYKLIFKAKLVYTWADLWPESFVATDVVRSNFIMKVCYAYRRWINKFPDMLICTTQGTLETFKKEGVPKERLLFVPVWVSTQGSSRGSVGGPSTSLGMTNERLGMTKGKPVIVYAGNLGPAQNLHLLLQGAKLLEENKVPVEFHFYGQGSEEESLKQFVQSAQLKSVFFKGSVSPEIAMQKSSEASAQIISLKPSPLFRMTIPSKLFASMSVARPLLCGAEGETASIAKASGGAFLFDPSSAESFADAVMKLVQSSPETLGAMSKRLKDYYDLHFERSKLIDSYREVLID